MKKSILHIIFSVVVLALLVIACRNSAPTPEPEAPTQVPAMPVTATSAPTATPEPTETKKPLVGPMATVAAMANQVTLNPPTPVGGFDTSDLQPDDYVGIFKQAWAIVDSNYYRDDFNGADWDAIYDEYLPRAEQLTSSEELHQLLSDLVGELNDGHSRFVPPDRMEAEFGVGQGGSARPWTGIEIWPAREDEYITAWYVCKYGPAADAGLVRGDVILAVDGEELIPGEEGFTREQSYAVMFGTGGSTVSLTVQSGPDESPRDVKLSLGGAGGCDDWRFELVSESPRIGYIRIPDFDGDAAANIFGAIQDMEAEASLDGLILDVRHNPGGNNDASTAIFTKGVVGTVGTLRADKQRTVYRIRQTGNMVWNETTPVAVLTDGCSNSAADYFPAAMKELGRATIIGMNSAGNTDGITGFGLADGTIIRLAVTYLLLNDGSSIEGVGVTPDIEVPLRMWGLRQQPYDVQLQAAIDYLSK